MNNYKLSKGLRKNKDQKEALMNLEVITQEKGEEKLEELMGIIEKTIQNKDRGVMLFKFIETG